MIGLEILIHIPSRHRHEFIQSFEILPYAKKVGHEGTRSCIERSIFECIDTPNRYIWMERWTDNKTLETYMQTDRFKAILGAIQILGKIDSIHKGEISEFKPSPPESSFSR